VACDPRGHALVYAALMPPSPLHRNIALAIAAISWAVGLPILALARDAGESLPFELTMDAKINDQRLERLAGKSALVYQELGAWLDSMFHGWKLGLTVGVLGSLFALAWYLLAPHRQQ
jgi:hypothetical protein